ncbi:MAG: DegT/DnrJ/EryC1/StrS aminotransferase family protein [Thermodesulfovibrionia bacterium]|nr:DegT/DnrJ/EryC1/StrS aminotransferase family protein [Thermodesulfovibrionia bacterium]
MNQKTEHKRESKTINPIKTTRIRSDFLPFGKPNFSDEEINAVAQIMRSGWIGMGQQTIAFEKELAYFVKAPYVVTTNSCTSALFLSLLVHGIKPGDEVICPSLTWCSTANSALYLGATPVFCDIDPDTLSLTPGSVLEKITDRTKAVIVVHMGGLAVQVDEIRRVLPAHIAIIEDAAHALGSRFEDGGSVGSSGNLTCFSFYANKNLSTGEGGAIALFDEKQAERLSSLRQNCLAANAWKRYIQPQSALIPGLEELGYKMNYTDLQASIGRVQLKRQGDFQTSRLKIAKRYHEQLKELLPSVRFQRNILHLHHSRHLFQILLPLEDLRLSRNELLLELRSRNIGASIHYAPLHSMPLYADKKPLSHTEALSKRIMTLPISASMDKDDVDYVIDHLKELLR